MGKFTERLTATVLILRLTAEGIAWGALAALGVMALILVATALGNAAHAAEPPAPGMTCTYTRPLTSEVASPSRTYVVEVLGTFEASYERDGPWLWVKRPGQARYQSVIVPPATLSGCRS